MCTVKQAAVLALVEKSVTALPTEKENAILIEASEMCVYCPHKQRIRLVEKYEYMIVAAERDKDVQPHYALSDEIFMLGNQPGKRTFHRIIQVEGEDYFQTLVLE